MVASGSNRFSIASSTMRLRRSGVISPYRNEAPQRQGFQGVAKEHESFKSNKWNSYSKVYSKSPELVPYYSIRRASRTRPVSPTVEKTLSVDTVNVAGILSSHSSDSKALVCVNAKASNNNVNTTRDRILNDGIENAKISLVLCPPSPLLPKTPSESWLWRTLPSISSHSLLNRGINFQSKRHDPCISSANTKWESIVKSSYLHHDHVRYSEVISIASSYISLVSFHRMGKFDSQMCKCQLTFLLNSLTGIITS